MSLTVETGAGVQDAEAYASVAYVTSYWANQTQSALAAPWAASTTPLKEGAIREATAYLDATYGPFYVGTRRGRLQGLLWPRSNALDPSGYQLPDLPDELKKAVAELAGRVISSGEPLADDVDPLTMVTREKKKIGPIEKELEYGGAVSAGGASSTKSFGIVDGLMNMLVTNGPGGFGSWAWS
jgi:hypothetical protein